MNQQIEEALPLSTNYNIIIHCYSLYLLFICLYKYSIRFNLLNEFLCPLSKHRRLIHCSNEIHLLAIKSLSQMN